MPNPMQMKAPNVGNGMMSKVKLDDVSSKNRI